MFSGASLIVNLIEFLTLGRYGTKKFPLIEFTHLTIEFMTTLPPTKPPSTWENKISIKLEFENWIVRHVIEAVKWRSVATCCHLFSIIFHWRLQCDQVVRFLKVLGDMVSPKSSPNTQLIFGITLKATLFMLNYCGYFLGNFGLLFNSASGHSADEQWTYLHLLNDITSRPTERAWWPHNYAWSTPFRLVAMQMLTTSSPLTFIFIILLQDYQKMLQLDSNSGCRSWTRVCWPLDQCSLSSPRPHFDKILVNLFLSLCNLAIIVVQCDQKKIAQISIKAGQKWFHKKNEWLWHIYKNCLRMWEIWTN